MYEKWRRKRFIWITQSHCFKVTQNILLNLKLSMSVQVLLYTYLWIKNKWMYHICSDFQMGNLQQSWLSEILKTLISKTKQESSCHYYSVISKLCFQKMPHSFRNFINIVIKITTHMVFIPLYVCEQLWSFTYNTYIHININIHIQYNTYIYTYIHTCTHTYIQDLVVDFYFIWTKTIFIITIIYARQY